MKTITGTFRNPDNSAVANGILKLRLSQVCNISGTALIAPQEVVINLNSSGQIPAATQIYANDELTPSGTTYYMTLYSASMINGVQTQGGQIFQQQVAITGTTPIDLTTLTPSSQGVSLVVPISSVGLTMPSEFSVAGSPLTGSGTIAVTKSNESANLVFAGPTTGAPAAPTFRALVDADIPVTLTNHTLATPTITSPTTTGTDAGVETLKNKTLLGASMGNNVTKLNSQANLGVLTGNGSAQVVFTYTLPANTVALGEAIRLTVATNQSAVATTFIHSLNGQTFDNRANSSANDFWQFIIINTGAATGLSLGTAYSGTVSAVSNIALASLNWAANQVLQLTFNVANPNTVTPLLWVVEKIQ